MGKKYSDGKKYKVVAVVHARFSGEDQQELIKSIVEKSRLHNCRTVFFSTLSSFFEEDYDTAELSIFDTIAVERFDAIILMAETFKSEAGQHKLIQRATEAGVPVFAVDHPEKGCINVTFDYKEGFREVVKHMVEYHGYRNVFFLAGVENNSFSDERIEVYKEVLEENQIVFDEKKVYYGGFWENPTMVAMNQMFEEHSELPEAIICANDVMALTACDFLQKKGIRVPEDVAVSGFDGVDTGLYHQPRLLTNVYDGGAFADAVFRLINISELAPGEREIKVSAYQQLQIGGSCGCKGMDALDAAAKIIEIKSGLYQQMEYQNNLGRMVANYGEGEGMDIIQKVLPERMKDLRYFDFWLCSQKRVLLTDYPQFSMENQEQDNELYNMIHYEKEENGCHIDFIDQVSGSDLIPNLDKQMKQGSTLLVVSVPTQENPKAYAVISMNPKTFWYTAYSSFIFHLRFLLDMQNSKRKLMQVYRTDSLTGVLNRNGFYATMNQIIEHFEISELTVISLDMCKFKEINDTYGHAEGDVALKEVGRIIRESVSYRDISARIGGDEFLIVLFEEKHKERIDRIVASIQEKAEAFNAANTKDYKLIFSIGVFTESLGDNSLDYFLKEADQKMYAHKKEQKMGR